MRRLALVTAVLVGASAIGPVASATAAAAGSPAAGSPATGSPATGSPLPSVLAIMPAGNNGLVDPAQAAAFEATGARPAASQDQLAQYEGLPFAGRLTDAALGNYFNPERFAVPPAQVASVERPDPSVPVTIVWDTHGIPHITGDSLAAMAYGAGYAAAQTRLFLMDVLRHYGAGTLSSFIGPSCSDELMDRSSLLSAPYTKAAAQAQLAALPTEFPAHHLGADVVAMAHAYIAGVNRYISAALTNPSLLPADYLAIGKLPQPWHATDFVAIASLVGGIFGAGGGSEVQNAGLFSYLQSRLGAAGGAAAFASFKEQNDPAAPTTITDRAFPYEIPGRVDPALTAMPAHPFAALTGGPTGTTPGCNLSAPAAPSLPAAGSGPAAALSPAQRARILASVHRLVAAVAQIRFPLTDSNALVLSGKDTRSGHPVAVFGPQVGYFAPQILMQETLQAPGYAAAGSSFPGTNLVVELGRGTNFAWSATSAGTDVVDQRLLHLCNPSGGAVAANQPDYVFRGHCIAMSEHTFTEVATPTAGGIGAPAVINHQIYFADGGVVQGWTQAVGGAPVAVVTVRSTYGHEVDSAIGFLQMGMPGLTYNATTWMHAVSQIEYTFNWFYVGAHNAAYYQSGLDPIRPSDVNPNLPIWGGDNAGWRGFLSYAGHPHEINPAQGYFTSWNNKPAPLFSASDSNFAYGPVYRSQMLDAAIHASLARHHGRLSRANLVEAMSSASTVDLTAVSVWPQLLSYLALHKVALTPGETGMLEQLRAWLAAGAHRIEAAPGRSLANSAQYRNAAAIAISDQLFPQVVSALFGPIFAAGGVVTSAGQPQAFKAFPQMGEGYYTGFVNQPGSVGSAYDGGWEGYVQKALDELNGQPVAQPFATAVTSHLCGAAGPNSCPQAIAAALSATYLGLVSANGGATNPATWTADSITAAAGETMPQHDAIQFEAVGIVGQPSIEWQNRPTFQQVAEFTGPSVHPAPGRTPAAAAKAATLAYTGLPGEVPEVALGLLLAAAGLALLLSGRGPRLPATRCPRAMRDLRPAHRRAPRSCRPG